MAEIDEVVKACRAAIAELKARVLVDTGLDNILGSEMLLCAFWRRKNSGPILFGIGMGEK